MTVNTRASVTVLSTVPYGYEDLEQSLEMQPCWPRAKLALEIVMRERKKEKERKSDKEKDREREKWMTGRSLMLRSVSVLYGRERDCAKPLVHLDF